MCVQSLCPVRAFSLNACQTSVWRPASLSVILQQTHSHTYTNGQEHTSKSGWTDTASSWRVICRPEKKGDRVGQSTAGLHKKVQLSVSLRESVQDLVNRQDMPESHLLYPYLLFKCSLKPVAHSLLVERNANKQFWATDSMSRLQLWLFV